MESVFAVVDIFFVARLGPEAVAVVGLTEAVVTILFAIAIGLSMGVTALVARRVGEGDRADCLRIIAYGYVFYAVGMVLTQAFNGAGDTYTPTCINLVCFWLLQVPLAYALAEMAGFGPEGVFYAVTIGESSIAVLAVLVFLRGRWKLKVV